MTYPQSISPRITISLIMPLSLLILLILFLIILFLTIFALVILALVILFLFSKQFECLLLVKRI